MELKKFVVLRNIDYPYNMFFTTNSPERELCQGKKQYEVLYETDDFKKAQEFIFHY